MPDSLKDYFDRIQAQYGTGTPQRPGIDPVAAARQRMLGDKSIGEELMSLPGTALSSTLELFGFQKDAHQQAIEEKYPISSLAAGLFGVGIPYIGAFKAIDKIGDAAKFLDKIGDVAKSPIKTAVLRDTAKMGMIEAGRVAINQAIPGGESFEQAAGEGLLNIGLGIPLSGGLAALTQGGIRKAPLQEIFKDIDLNAAPQVQRRQLGDAIAAGKIDPKFTVEAQNRYNRLGEVVRVQTAPEGQPFVRPLVGGGKGQSMGRLFNHRANRKKGNNVIRRRFIRGDEAAFKTDKEWQDKAATFGLPPNWLDFVQYPRHLSFKHPDAAKSIQNVVNKNLTSAGDGWYVGQEAGDGLFVMARKMPGKTPTPKPKGSTATRTAVDDEWVIFKTDQPGQFRPLHAKWSTAVADHMEFLAKPPVVTGPVSPIYDAAAKMADTMPLRKYIDSGAAKGSIADLGNAMAKTLGLDDALKNSGEVTKRVKDFFVEHLAPTIQQFGRSPRAGRVMAIAQATTDAAESLWRQVVYGERVLAPGKNPMTAVFGKDTAALSGDSLKKLIGDLSDDEVNQFWTLWKSEAKMADVDQMFADGKITDKVRDFAKKVDSIDNDISNMIIKTEQATGERKFKRKEGHYGLSRMWDGDNRVALRDVEGKLVGVAGGKSRVGAMREAEKLKVQLEGEGIPTNIAEEFDITQSVNLPRDIKLQINNPAWLLERQNIRGFAHDLKPFTKDELLEAFGNSISKRTRYMANKTIVGLMGDDMSKLAIEDPQMHKLLVGRMNDLAGVQTPFGKLQNQLVDSVLAPVLGTNTASQLVAFTNKAMWHLELGALRLAYPVMNMLTFIQTVLPEVAFVRTADPEILAKYYTTYTARGATSARPMGVLEPLKIWRQATANMTSKDPRWAKMVQRGLNEGVIDPRFIEDYAGQTGARANLKNALKEGGMTKWLGAVSEYLPAQSEKFSRANAFSTGYMVGKDLLGIADDEFLYKFAKDFTDRTMYRYGMESRPRAFTTPLGSGLGLFKNWMLNYMGQMLDYTAEGAMRNNWAPLIWQTAGTFGVAGLSGVPLYGVANQLSEWMDGKSALVKGYDFMGPDMEKASDAIFFGLPAAITGISLSGNAAAPGANPMRDATQLFSMAHWDRVNAAGKAFSAAMDHFNATGETPLADPNTRDMFLRAFAPKTVYRAAQAAEEGIISSTTTGYPILKGVSDVDQWLFRLGFNPLEIEKAYAVSDEMWKDQEAHRAAIQAFGKAMAEAYSMKDQREMDMIAQRAVMQGIDLSSIERSAMSRLSKAEADVITRSFDDAAIEERMNVLGSQYTSPNQGAQ